MRTAAIMLTWTVAVALHSVVGADEPAAGLPHAKEQAAWEVIAARFTHPPTANTDRQGRLVRLEARGLKSDAPDKGWARVELDAESGHVVRFSADRAAFTNEELAVFAQFPRLERLTLWHNSNFHDRSVPIEEFDGSGLAALHDLPHLTHLTLAGGGLADAGLEAAAKLPAITSLGLWHTRISDVGMAAWKDHPRLEEINLGPFWAEELTDRTARVLGGLPKIRKVVFKETYLTFEGGLRPLLAAESLEELDLGNSLLEPEDVKRLAEFRPDVKLTWGGLEAAGEVFQNSGWHLGKARRWMPAELIDRALKAAE